MQNYEEILAKKEYRFMRKPKKKKIVKHRKYKKTQKSPRPPQPFIGRPAPKSRIVDLSQFK